MDLVSQAARFLQIKLPCTEDDLKSAYRTACKKLHPDIGGDPELFKEMKKVYDLLMETPEILLVGDHTDKRERTVDGSLLTELGLGLGPTVNGRDCPRCERKGYTTVHDYVNLPCLTCDGHGDIMKCRDCLGSGKFKQKFTGKEVACRRCQGKGFWPCPKIEVEVTSFRGDFSYIFGGRIPQKVLRRRHGAQGCPDCKASGEQQVQTKKSRHYKCGECNGTGEIKIYNPVIMKGGLGLTQKQRKKLEAERSSS